jgi:hypothetical protein
MMATLELIADGTADMSGPEFDPKAVAYTSRCAVIGMPHGTVLGRPTVLFRMTLPDGQDVFAETTLALFLTAADALKARYGDPRR